MESGVLKYSEENGLPIIVGINELWGSAYKPGKVFTCNHRGWIKAKAPIKNKRHLCLGYLWRENVGLYLVFCDEKNWDVFDPTNQRVTLSKYVDDNEDWQHYRIDGFISDTREGAELGSTMRIRRIVKWPSKPKGSKPSENNPLIIGDLSITKYKGYIPCSIGTGNRLLEIE